MNNIFTDINLKKPKSNTFDLSHDKKMSLKMGELVPILCVETIPGDVFNMSSAQLLRFAPMIAPVMHRVNVYTHFFFVPNRILWDGFETFINGGEDGADNRIFPYINRDLDDLDIGSIADYLGIPVDYTNRDLEFSALPFAAYGKIYNEYYRDQNLVDEVDVSLIDGDNDGRPIWDMPEQDCFKRAWQHDYFTSCLPFTQKGAQATIPLGQTAPIINNPDITSPQILRRVSDSAQLSGVNLETIVGGTLTGDGVGADTAWLDPNGSIVADLSTATAAGIIDLRRAFKLQEWLELNARGGSRYTETILAHFGVKSSDARLQRPEFLGGATSTVKFSEVLQTSANDTEPTPQGNMAGHGINMGSNGLIRHFSEEHGYIIGIMSVMPKTAYYQGLHRHWSRWDKFDYYWPAFAHIGEQAVKNKEIYIDTDNSVQEGTFGYIPRYAAYKFLPSTVHGEFRTSLDFWHMGRKFANQPQLNADFINCDATTRIFAVEQGEQLYAHIHHKIKAQRRMPYFGNPKM